MKDPVECSNVSTEAILLVNLLECWAEREVLDDLADLDSIFGQLCINLRCFSLQGHFIVCMSVYLCLSLGLFWSERIIWKWMLIEGQIIWFNLLILIQSKIKQIIGQQIITHDSINKYQNARPRNFLVWEKWSGSRRQSSSLKVIQNFNAKTKYLFLKSTLSFRPLLHRKWIL